MAAIPTIKPGKRETFLATALLPPPLGHSIHIKGKFTLSVISLLIYLARENNFKNTSPTGQILPHPTPIGLTPEYHPAIRF